MASIRKRTTKSGVRYDVRYRDLKGASRERSFKRKVDATRFSNSIETDLHRGEYLDPQAGATPFNEVADRWLATRADKARATTDRDRSYLASMILGTFGGARVSAIAPSHIESWLAHLDKAPATRAKAFQILKNILDLARRDKMIRTNPAEDIEVPQIAPVRPGKALTDTEVQSVLNAAELVDPRTAVLVYLMSRCGLRVGEAIALRWSDVNLRTGTLSVRTSMSRREGVRPVKGRLTKNEGRQISIPQDVVNRLRTHLHDRHVDDISDFVVTAPNGGAITYSNWRRRTWSKIVEMAGVDAVPHDLRKTAATRLFVQDRWTVGEVQAFLGHRDPRTTLGIYTLIQTTSLPRPSDLGEGTG